MNSGKVEERAILALEQMIQDHPTMEPNINRNDKNIAKNKNLKQITIEEIGRVLYLLKQNNK